MSLTLIKSTWLIISSSYSSFQTCSSINRTHAVCVCFPRLLPGFLFIGQQTHVVDPPKASKTIKNSSAARWCLLNQVCVILQMHSASLTQRERAGVKNKTHGLKKKVWNVVFLVQTICACYTIIHLNVFSSLISNTACSTGYYLDYRARSGRIECTAAQRCKQNTGRSSMIWCESGGSDAPANCSANHHLNQNK